MKCLRCGYCCIELSVIIIDPKYTSEDIHLFDLPEEAFIHKPSSKICPHLEIKNNMVKCKIHEFKWYKETPCYQYSQIEYRDSICRIGQAIKEGKLSWKLP